MKSPFRLHTRMSKYTTTIEAKTVCLLLERLLRITQEKPHITPGVIQAISKDGSELNLESFREGSRPD